MADIGASNWNEDDASNNAPAPDGWPEGMPPSGVNNAARAMMGAIKRWYDWSIPKTTAGSGSAYTLNYSVAPGALVDGMSFMVEFHVANNANPTLAVNILGAIPIRHFSNGTWYGLPPAWAAPNSIYRLVYHASSGVFRIMGGDQTQPGVMVPFAGGVAPAGYLLCYGQAVSRTQYPALFAAVGTTHGAGDGSTTFNLPDLRGRVAAGKSDMGGVDAGNLAGGGTLGAALGAQTTALSGNAAGTLGALSVTVSGLTDDPANGLIGGAGGSGSAFAGAAHQHAFNGTGSTGPSGVSFPISGTAATVQPTRVLNYLIHT